MNDSNNAQSDNILANRDAVRKQIGISSNEYLPDERLDLMLAMTQQNVQQTILMALGYIIQSLELQIVSSHEAKKEYEEKIAYYKKLLKTHQQEGNTNRSNPPPLPGQFIS